MIAKNDYYLDYLLKIQILMFVILFNRLKHFSVKTGFIDNFILNLVTKLAGHQLLVWKQNIMRFL